MDSFGLDALGPLTSEEGSGMFRPEVVLSRKGGSNHIFRDLSRISGPVSCPLDGMSRGAVGSLCGRTRRRRLRPRPLIFGCERTNRRPLRGRDRISFREAEAPAEPYTTEKTRNRWWLGRRLSLLDKEGIGSGGAASFSRRNRVPRAR